MVIHGLHDIDVSEINNELNSKNINPCDIKKLIIKKPRQEAQLLYVIYFLKNQHENIHPVNQDTTPLSIFITYYFSAIDLIILFNVQLI